MRAGYDWVTFRRVHCDGRELLIEMEKFCGNSWKDWLNWRIALVEFMQCMGYDEDNEQHMQWLAEDLMSLLLQEDLDVLLQFVNRSEQAMPTNPSQPANKHPQLQLQQQLPKSALTSMHSSFTRSTQFSTANARTTVNTDLEYNQHHPTTATNNKNQNHQSQGNVPWTTNVKQALAELTRMYCPKGTRALILKELGHLRKTSCSSVRDISRQFRVLLRMIGFLEHDENAAVPLHIQLKLFANTMPVKWQRRVMNQNHQSQNRDPCASPCSDLGKLEAQFVICERKCSQLCRIVGYRDTKHGGQVCDGHQASRSPGAGIPSSTLFTKSNCRCATGRAEASRYIIHGGNFDEDSSPECFFGEEAFDEISDEARDVQASASASIAMMQSFRERRPSIASDADRAARLSKKKSWLGIQRLSAWFKKRRRSFKSLHIDSNRRTQRARTRSHDDFNANYCDPDPTAASATVSPTCCSYVCASEGEHEQPTPQPLPKQKPRSRPPQKSERTPKSETTPKPTRRAESTPQPRQAPSSEPPAKSRPAPASKHGVETTPRSPRRKGPRSKKPSQQKQPKQEAEPATVPASNEQCIEIEVVRSFHLDSSLAVKHELSAQPQSHQPNLPKAKAKVQEKGKPKTKKTVELEEDSSLTSFHIDSQRFNKTCLVSSSQPKRKRHFYRHNSLPLSRHNQDQKASPSAPANELESQQEIEDRQLNEVLDFEIQVNDLASPQAMSGAGSFSGFDEEDATDENECTSRDSSSSISPFFVCPLDRKGSSFAMLSEKEQVIELETCEPSNGQVPNRVKLDAQNPIMDKAAMTSFHF